LGKTAAAALSVDVGLISSTSTVTVPYRFARHVPAAAHAAIDLLRFTPSFCRAYRASAGGIAGANSMTNQRVRAFAHQHRVEAAHAIPCNGSLWLALQHVVTERKAAEGMPAP